MEANNSGRDSNFLKASQEGESYDLEILLRRPSLRTNVPRKSSQIYSSTVTTRENTCGIACFQGEWLQSFSTRTSFLVIYGALACFYGSFNAYFYGSITTLEKRFHLTSLSIGIIASTGDFVQVITCTVLSFCSIKSHRPRWIGVGIFLVFLSALTWSSTHFLCEHSNLLERGEALNFTLTEITSPEAHEDVLYVPLPIVYLSLAQILYGVGGSLFFALGTTYIEDNTKDYQTPAMLNLLLALKTVGLALGYWLSSMSLKIFTSRTRAPDITEANPKWIGAWWFGNLMVAFLVVIPGVLISFYPSSMPKSIVRRIFSGISKNDETNELRKGTSNILTSSLHYNNFSGIYNIFRFSVYFIFLTKYVEIQYQIPASKANFTVGTITLLCSSLGTVLSGSLISRYKPGITCLLAWNFTAGILSIGCLIYYIFLGCSNYESQIKSLILQLVAVSSDPKFQTSEIVYTDSVCDEFGQTYLSVGMIGCAKILNINHTIICDGISKNLTDFKIMKTLHKGPCPADCQLQFLKFSFTTCLMSFIYGSGKISNFLIHIKNINESERSRLLNWGVLLNMLTILPVPMLFGHYLDISCVLWDDSKLETGNCWLYDLEYIRLLFNLSAVAFAIVGIISDALVLFSMRNVKMNYIETD